MEGVQKIFHEVSKDLKSGASYLTENSFISNIKGGLTASLSSSDHSHVLVTTPTRQTVSLWTCSKLCTVFFVAGVFVGYTLKKRVQRWASKLLKRLRDD